RAALENGFKHGALSGPLARVITIAECVEVQVHPLDEFCKELWLERSDRYVFSVSTFINRVEWRASVENGFPALLLEHPLREHPVDPRSEQSRSINHGGIHHLAFSGRACLQQSAHQPECEHQPAAAEIADEVEGRHGRAALAADTVKRTGQGDVVDVVS